MYIKHKCFLPCLTPSKKQNAPIWVEGKIQCLQLRLPQEHPKQNAPGDSGADQAVNADKWNLYPDKCSERFFFPSKTCILDTYV